MLPFQIGTLEDIYLRFTAIIRKRLMIQNAADCIKKLLILTD